MSSKRGGTAGLMACIVAALPLVAVGADAPRPPERLSQVDSELLFAERLLQVLRLPDYACKVLDSLVQRYPESKPRAQALRITCLTSMGKFDAAQKEIAALTGVTAETLAMRLALGDAYYSAGKLSQAREIYEGFFSRYTNGPPQELKELYQRSADRFAQMLILKGDFRSALKVSKYFLQSKPEKDLARQCEAQMAELCLRLAKTLQGAEREQLLAQGKKLCEAQMWGEQDSVFAKCVVVMAHIMVENGKREEARQLLTDYLPMVKAVDDMMRQEKMSLRQSPMAECRYLHGILLEEDGRKAMEGKETKQGLALLKEALTDLYVVYTKYSDSTWAPEAGKRADALVQYLQSRGHKVTLPRTDTRVLMNAQLKEARTLLRDQDFAGAKQAYLEALSQYPLLSDQPRMVAELAQACAQDEDDVYAGAMIGHLSEHFRGRGAAEAEAGTLLLGVAGTYQSIGKAEKTEELFALFLRRFRGHDKEPLVLFRMGDSLLRRQQYADAEVCYRRIASVYTNLAVYPAALSHAAVCAVAREDYSNAVATLTQYNALLQPSPEKAEAMVRLGDAYRKSGKTVAAVNQYSRLLSALSTNAARYAGGAEDVARNDRTRQRALFWSAYCYSRLTQPTNQVALYRQRAVDAYNRLLEKPAAEFGASALAGLGMLYYLQDKPDEADRAYSRLLKEYPGAPEAKSILYTQGRCLVDIGQSRKAIDVFGKMFATPQEYTPVQFYQVGKLMSEARAFETAAKAFDLGRKGKDALVWEASTLGAAQALQEMGKSTEAAALIRELLAKAPRTGFAPAAYETLCRAYAGELRQEKEEKARFALYKEAVDAMTQLRSLTKEPVELARAEIVLADMQAAVGKEKDAVASLQRLLMFADFENAALAPALQEAYARVVPLLIGLQMYSEALDATQQYVAKYPRGPHIQDIRRWGAEARSKQATAGS